MVAYQERQRAIFSTVYSEGAILPMDLLQRISDPQNAQLDGLTPDAYHLSAIKLNEAINRAWTSLLGAWQRFKSEQSRLAVHESGTTLTRERWLLPLFSELGYGRLQAAKTLIVGERNYAISHSWQHTPIHLVSSKADLDRSVQGEGSAKRSSPHSLLQEMLNRSPEHLWGIVSNGLSLRILRNNVSLTRQAFVEFDLEEMFNNEVYADFVLLWLLCHQSRVESERPEGCWLEKWSQEAHATGTRALDDLRVNVEMAISALGSGFLSQSANGQLRGKLSAGTLSAMDYYNQLLRMVYRLLVLFVAEDRGILFDPAASLDNRKLYDDYYSTKKLRYQADHQLGTRHSDLYYGLKLVMEKLGEENGCRELGLPGLNGFLFSPEAVSDLRDCQLANYALLAAVRHLGYTESGRTRRIIDYKNLGSEELGSVYESLLELHPIFHLETGTFELASASGNERKTTGSYYTPTSLITCLLDSALDPVLNEAANKATPAEAEAAILNLKICDPACGSGHFLVAAAHRIAKRLAAVRTGDEEPALKDHRHALRDVVGRCIYGVDINSMAVELCKVSLWMEAIEPGKPLSFLDAHIQCGNTLLGTTPALLKAGIPDEAFESIEGDDKKICSEFKKLNKKLREGNASLFREDQTEPIWEQQGTLMHSAHQLDEMRDDSVADVRSKDDFFKDLRKSGAYTNALLWANAWCAAFVWKKTSEMRPPITLEEFRDIGRNPFTLAPWRRAEIERLAAQYQFFHWHLAFPDVFKVLSKEEENEQAGWSGGFDVVLGNTPWERIKIQEKEWFAVHAPEIAKVQNAAVRRGIIRALEQENPTLYVAFQEEKRQSEGESHLIRRSDRYPLCGRGDINTYALFAETDRMIVGPTGRVGCIVPCGIATDDTTKYFFQDISQAKALVSLTGFINEELLFPAVLHNFKFCLLVLTGSDIPVERPDFVFNCHNIEQTKESGRHFSLDISEINLLNPNTGTCPVFFWKRSAEITKEIYRRIPILDREGATNSWDISFLTMFHMTNDSHLFQTEPFGESVALYEAKMLHQYNHRYASYEHLSVGERSHILPPVEIDRLADPSYTVVPCYYVPNQDIDARLSNSTSHKWLLGYRDTTSVGLARTTIYSILPRVGASNKIPLVLLRGDADLLTPAFIACMNSFVFDFCAR